MAKVSAQDVARLTDSDMAEHRTEQIRDNKAAAGQRITDASPSALSPAPAGSSLSTEDKATIRTFLTDTLFDEGYEVHDGDVFHAQSGRSLRSEAFVALMQRLQQG